MFGNFFNFKVQKPTTFIYQPKSIFNSSSNVQPFVQYNNFNSLSRNRKPQIPKLSDDNLKYFYDIIVDIDNQIESLKNMKTKIEEIIKQTVESEQKNEETKEKINKVYDDQLTDNFVDDPINRTETQRQTKEINGQVINGQTVNQLRELNEQPKPINKNNVNSTSTFVFIPNKKKKSTVFNPPNKQTEDVSKQDIKEINGQAVYQLRELKEVKDDKEISDIMVDDLPAQDIQVQQKDEQIKLNEPIVQNTKQQKEKTLNNNNEIQKNTKPIDVDNMLSEQMKLTENNNQKKIKIQDEFNKEFEIEDVKTMDVKKLVNEVNENKLMNVLVNSIQKNDVF